MDTSSGHWKEKRYISLLFIWIFFAILGKKNCRTSSLNRIFAYYSVPPLIMAVYGDVKSKQFTLTDSTESKLNELKLPLNDIQPTYIALLCRDNNSKEYQLEVKQVTNTTDSIDLERKCCHHSQPYLKEMVESKVYFHYVGFEVSIV